MKKDFEGRYLKNSDEKESRVPFSKPKDMKNETVR